jgi:PKD repeat protein
MRASPLLVLIMVSILASSAFSEPIHDPQNHPPVAVASIQEDPDDLWTNMTVHFSSKGSHDVDGGDSICFIWDFGDETAETTWPNPGHVYERPGTYTVTLMVVDEKSTIDKATLDLTVQRDYGDSEIIIKALTHFSQKGFKDPGPDQVSQVAVRRDGWVAYMCDLQKGDAIAARVTVIGDRPADVYLFKHDEFILYRQGCLADLASSVPEGTMTNLTGEFSYVFRPPRDDRFYVVIDNIDRPPGTDTEGPVDYTISIDPNWGDTTPPPPSWDEICTSTGPVFGTAVLLIAMLATFDLLRRIWKEP